MGGFVEVEEADGVGDGCAVLANGLGDLVLGEFVVVLEASVGGGLFDGVEVFAL